MKKKPKERREKKRLQFMVYRKFVLLSYAVPSKRIFKQTKLFK